ncbi:MAG: DNA-binding domain-containing protein [Gallionella sp.]|jgi:hypothetical protein
MSNLHDDLAQFARAIVQGQALPAQAGAIYPNYCVDTAIEVYRNNYRGNLHDALAGAYPVIVQLVGADFFRFMARSYIGEHPSRSANLYCYGDKLAEFLGSFEPAQGLVYLADVARLEWACQAAYLAADEPLISLPMLAKIPAEDYPDLVLHTGCQLIYSNYPVAAIWHAHQAGQDCDFHIDLESGASIARVSRIDDVVRVDELSEADAHWLQAIQDEQTLGVATAATLALYPDFDLQAALLDVHLTGFHYGA